MISNEERRKVAANLREVAYAHNHDVAIHSDEFHGFLGIGNNQHYVLRSAVLHLADLIDRPTCYLASCEIDNGSVSWGVRCTECNERFEHVLPNEYNYCPNCGSEVIE